MNGTKLLLDTNAIIQLLKGHPELIKLTQSAEYIGISIISQLEFASFSNLTQHDKTLFQKFQSRIDLLGITPSQTELIQKIIELRTNNTLKLPDAIIAATALQQQATLVTADKKLCNALNANAINFQPI